MEVFTRRRLTVHEVGVALDAAFNDGLYSDVLQDWLDPVKAELLGLPAQDLVGIFLRRTGS